VARFSIFGYPDYRVDLVIKLTFFRTVLLGLAGLIHSAARTACADAIDSDGTAVRQKPLWDLVKPRFAGGVLDA
jgi:hypothetical protein